MKTRIALILSGLLIPCGLSLAQQAGQALPGVNLPPGVMPAPHRESDASLTRFDLDFPGGTPEQLVRTLEKASGKPLNAIVPIEYADLLLPPLKMKSVTVPALFEALQLASQKTEQYVSGTVDYGGVGVGTRKQYQQFTSNYGFRTQGPPSDNSVWFFYNNQRPRIEEPKACRFYQLAPYLETYKVEDITTAIQTGWKMLAETSPPTISYHKDTKLLVAVGEGEKLQLIENVLRQLDAPRQLPTPPTPKGDTKPSPSKAVTEKPTKSE